MTGVRSKLAVSTVIVLLGVGVYSHVAFGRSENSSLENIQTVPSEFIPEDAEQANDRITSIEREALELQNRTLIEAVLQLRREVTTLKNLSADAPPERREAAISALIEELTDLKADRDRLSRELDSQVQNAALQPTDAAVDNTALQEQLNGFQALEQEHKELLTELGVMADSKEQLEAQVHSLATELETTKASLSQASEAPPTDTTAQQDSGATSEALLALSSQFKEQEQKLNVMAQERDQAIKTSSSAEKQLAQIQEEQQSALRVLAEKDTELAKVKKAFGILKQSQEEGEQKVAQAHADQMELAALKKAHKEALDELLKNRTSVESAQAELAKLRESSQGFDDLFARYKMLEKQNNELTSLTDTLKAEHERAVSEREALNSSTQAQFKAAEELNKALEISKITLSQQEEELAKNSKILRKMGQELETSNHQVEVLSNENDKLELALNSERERTKEAEDRVDAVARRAAEKIADLSRVRNDAEACIAELDQHRKIAERAGDYKRELVELKNELLLKETEMKSLGNGTETQASGSSVGAGSMEVEPRVVPVQDAPVNSDVLIVEVTTPKANLRSGPGYEHSPVMQIARGTRLTVEARQGEWYRVISPTGSRAYIQAEVVYDGKAPRAAASNTRKAPREETNPLFDDSASYREPARPKKVVKPSYNTEDVLEQRARRALSPIGGTMNAPSKPARATGGNGMKELEDQAFEDLRRSLLSGSEGS